MEHVEIEEPAEATRAQTPRCRRTPTWSGVPDGAAKPPPSTKCSFCKKILKNAGSLKKHKSVMHGGPDGNPYEIWCKYCKKMISANNATAHTETASHKEKGIKYNVEKERKQKQLCK